MGKTTTDENLQAEKRYWQKFFLTKELDEKALKNFLYGTNPFNNYIDLIDTRNHEAEGSLKSEKQLAKIDIVRTLLERLDGRAPETRTPSPRLISRKDSRITSSTTHSSSVRSASTSCST